MTDIQPWLPPLLVSAVVLARVGVRGVRGLAGEVAELVVSLRRVVDEAIELRESWRRWRER